MLSKYAALEVGKITMQVLNLSTLFTYPIHWKEYFDTQCEIDYIRKIAVLRNKFR